MDAPSRKSPPHTKTTHARKPHLFYLDFIRAIAAFCVVLAHFQDPYLREQHYFILHPFGIYVGGIGVSLFLIVSGAALMYTYGDRDTLNLKQFYARRARALYPPFWIAYIITYIALYTGGGDVHFDFVGHPARLIYSVLAFDGYARFFGIPNFYLLGEWFLGFIIIFYLIFPLMRVGTKKYPALSGAIAFILCILTFVYYPQLPHPKSLPVELLLSTRLPELLFGMLFVRYIKQVKSWQVGLAAILLCVQEITRACPSDPALPLTGICLFILLVWIAERVRRIRFIAAPTRIVSSLSYPIFLVHHVIIAQVYTVIQPADLTRFEAYGLFVVELCVILLCSQGLLMVSAWCTQTCTQMFRGRKRVQS